MTWKMCAIYVGVSVLAAVATTHACHSAETAVKAKAAELALPVKMELLDAKKLENSQLKLKILQEQAEKEAKKLVEEIQGISAKYKLSKGDGVDFETGAIVRAKPAEPKGAK